MLPTQEIGKNINKTRNNFLACRLRSGCLDNGYACQKTIVVFLFLSLHMFNVGSLSIRFPLAGEIVEIVLGTVLFVDYFQGK